MSFSFNLADTQQLSLRDSYESLTEREKRFLDRSWAKVFSEKIFPKIDEAPYAVLYSQNASRPNVIKCVNGQTPKSCSYNARTGQCTVSFHKCQCEGCPYAGQCRRKVFNRTVRPTISIKSKHRAQQQRSRTTDEFKAMSHFRNGVEAIPSFMRRLFDVDHMPVRGKLRTKFFFGCKIGGLNLLGFSIFSYIFSFQGSFLEKGLFILPF